MPTFELQTPQGSFEVEAPDQQTAIRALSQMGASGDSPEMAARKRQGLSPDAPAFNPPDVSGYDPQTGNVDKMGALGTFMSSGAEGVPIAGPLLDAGVNAASAGIGSMMTGDPYSKVKGQIENMRDVGNQENPLARMGGNVAGALAVLGPIGATETGGWALGVNGPSLVGRTGMSMLSSGGISAADTAARGGSLNDVLKSGAIGGGLGAAFPLVGAGLSKGIGAGVDYLGNLIRSAKAPASEAERRLGIALRRDAGTAMTPADEATARSANVPLTNVDRGGETTRALARSAANQSPEARSAIDNMASDRFAGQGSRAVDFVRKLVGSNVDDLSFQDAIANAARKANKPAYDLAESKPAAQAMWNADLSRLMQAPAVQRAAMSATTRGANRAAVEGFVPIRNPFMVKDGKLTFATDAQGNVIKPTLRFWDQVKRNLDGEIGKAKRAGDNTLAADMTALKKQLVDTLDTAVPEYKAARQGAAGFFGAEDALDAGRKFANTPRAIPEAKRAFMKFNSLDRKAFETGYASELIDKIKASSDRVNVINQTFKSQAARESMGMVFGPQKMKQIEAYVRVEDLVDRVRGAMGNSTTARQLVELGIGGGTGYAVTGDWKGAVAGAALVRGPRYIQGQIEQNVMKELGKLLAKDDPALVQKLVSNAALSPKYMKALENVATALQITGQAATPKLSQ